MRRGWVVVLTVVLAVGVAAVYVRSRPIQYASSATLELAATNVSLTSPLPLSAEAPTMVASAAGFLRTTPQNAAVAASEVTVSQDVSTGLIVVSATDPLPGPAQQYAGAFAEAYISVLQARATASLASLQKERSSLASQITALAAKSHGTTSPLVTDQLTAASQAYGTVESQIVALETAPPPATLYSGASIGSRIATSKKKVFGLAGLAGLLAGIGLVLIWGRFDTRLRFASDVVSTAPVLAEIPFQARLNSRRGAGRPVIPVVDTPGSLLADRVRELRTAIQSAVGGRSSTVVLVASNQEGDGKSFLVANLATSWALAGGRAVAVSTDLRSQHVESLLGAAGAERGLSTLLAAPAAANSPIEDGDVVGTGQAGVADPPLKIPGERDCLPDAESVLSALVTSRVAGLSVLPAGPPVDGDPGDLLASAAMGEVVRHLRRSFDLVVLDSPAVGRVSDAVALASSVDNVLVVARANRTDQRTLRDTVARFTAAGAVIGGIVLNRSANHRTSQQAYAPDYGNRPGPLPDNRIRRIDQGDTTLPGRTNGRER